MFLFIQFWLCCPQMIRRTMRIKTRRALTKPRRGKSLGVKRYVNKHAGNPLVTILMRHHESDVRQYIYLCLCFWRGGMNSASQWKLNRVRVEWICRPLLRTTLRLQEALRPVTHVCWFFFFILVEMTEAARPDLHDGRKISSARFGLLWQSELKLILQCESSQTSSEYPWLKTVVWAHPQLVVVAGGHADSAFSAQTSSRVVFFLNKTYTHPMFVLLWRQIWSCDFLWHARSWESPHWNHLVGGGGSQVWGLGFCLCFVWLNI